MRLLEYNEKDINKILEILDRTEVKGFKNMNEMLWVMQTLQKPIPVVPEKEGKKE